MTKNSTPQWVKRLAQIAGALWMLPGLLSLPNLFCVNLFMLNESASTSARYSIFSLTLTLLTFGAGLAMWRFASDALKGKTSRPMRLPPTVVLVGVFGLLMILGGVISRLEILPGLFLSPIFLVLAVLPPVWAVAWFIPRDVSLVAAQTGEHSPAQPASSNSLTWRHGLTAFIGGGTIGVALALILEILLPVIVIALVFGLSATVLDSLDVWFTALSNAEVAHALTNPGFIYLFVELAVIAPLAEEIAKPLITLPLLKHLDEKQTFWLGALAGAGFAALENIIYAAAGYPIWAGIFLVRALGGALHPLGAGLVAMGWRDVLRGAPNAGRKWLSRFGIAFLVHAAWNGGSLLVITLGGARFFGELPPEVDILGLSAAGTTLAFLLLLGISALWIGRAFGHGQTPLLFRGEAATETDFLPSDRALAIWAFACLVAIVPAGIAGLKLWLR
jgi:RsiW-degrading membrane proteinase PrsW (M82 family)